MIKDLLENKDITITEAVDALKAGGYKKSVINKFIRPYKEIGLGLWKIKWIECDIVMVVL